MSLRDIKAQARGDLNDEMKVAAYYYPFGSLTPTSCHVRVHTKLNKQQGDLKGTNFSYAETEQHIPALLFWLSELATQGITLERNAVVMIGATEGYRVDHMREPDGLSITAEVAALTANQRAAYSYPGA